MFQNISPATNNLLLGSLSAEDYALLNPHFERVKLAREQVLASPGQPIQHAYSLDGGVASITSDSDENDTTEVV